MESGRNTRVIDEGDTRCHLHEDCFIGVFHRNANVTLSANALYGQEDRSIPRFEPHLIHIVFMSTHSKNPFITPSMDISSGKGVVRGRRGQQLEFALPRTPQTQ